MAQFEITEVVTYTVEADDADDAMEKFIEHGPPLPPDASPVKFKTVDERIVEKA